MKNEPARTFSGPQETEYQQFKKALETWSTEAVSLVPPANRQRLADDIGRALSTINYLEDTIREYLRHETLCCDCPIAYMVGEIEVLEQPHVGLVEAYKRLCSTVARPL